MSMMLELSSVVAQVLYKGRVAQLVFIIIMGVLSYVSYYLAYKQGKTWKIRTLEGLETVNEGIGRAAEMGRPILVLPGISGLSSAQTIAGLTFFGEIAQRGAEIGLVTNIVTSSTQVVAATEAISQQVYRAVGKPELYEPGKFVKWYGGGQFVYAVGAAGHILQERPAFVVMMGYFLADVIVSGETATRVGALSIGGSTDQSAIPLMGMMCDTVLIGEEMYAASAAISGDKMSMATIVGEDWVKVILLALMVIGVLAWAAGSKVVYNLLGM